MKIKNVEIEKNTLNAWIEKFLPEYDLFFFPAKYESIIEYFDSNILIMPSREFFNHSSFNNIDTLNSYQYWKINKDIAFVCVVHPVVIAKLDNNKRKTIFKIQREVNRGLIFEWDFINSILISINSNLLQESLLHSLSPYSFEHESKRLVCIQKSLWNSLNQEFKYKFLLQLADDYVDQVEIDDNLIKELTKDYPHISSFFNTFPTSNGANCLSSTLAAISEKK
jgi:hypothetical protein